MQLRRFSQSELTARLARQPGLPFSYAAVGASAGNFPRGYDHDYQRVLLGTGDDAFSAACDALRRWRQFPPSWTAIYPPDAPQTAGKNVLMLCRVLGLWWASGCRIVYMIDDAGPPRRFGFAYGTLPSHVEYGEERFVVEMDGDGRVWYELAAFSRPRHWLLKLGYPLVRRYQARFRRESAAAMQSAVQQAGHVATASRAQEGCR
jgi:uncharacterized protein (UPF0548 family)